MEGAKSVSEGREVISTAGNQMKEMTARVFDITGKMEEVAGILSQQSQASNEVAEGIATIAQMTGNNVTQIEAIVEFLADVDEEMVRSMDEVMTQQIPNMTIYRAKSDHVI